MRDTWTEEELAALQVRIGETNLVCGIDEVGRGPLAGPVVACAIIMPHGEKIDGVRDSKKLSEKKREQLFDVILEHCIAWGIGQSDERVIDEINIRQATLLAMREALLSLKTKEGQCVVPDLVLVDAEHIDTDVEQISIVHGDDRIYAISCASIIAKVMRDRMMRAYDAQYPEYGFAAHKGYGTKAHYAAIRRFGVLPIHRRSFLHGKDRYEKNNEAHLSLPHVTSASNTDEKDNF